MVVNINISRRSQVGVWLVLCLEVLSSFNCLLAKLVRPYLQLLLVNAIAFVQSANYTPIVGLHDTRNAIKSLLSVQNNQCSRAWLNGCFSHLSG